jgi:hypothetical protein
MKSEEFDRAFDDGDYAIDIDRRGRWRSRQRAARARQAAGSTGPACNSGRIIFLIVGP